MESDLNSLHTLIHIPLHLPWMVPLSNKLAHMMDPITFPTILTHAPFISCSPQFDIIHLNIPHLCHCPVSCWIPSWRCYTHDRGPSCTPTTGHEPCTSSDRHKSRNDSNQHGQLHAIAHHIPQPIFNPLSASHLNTISVSLMCGAQIIYQFYLYSWV